MSPDDERNETVLIGCGVAGLLLMSGAPVGAMLACRRPRPSTRHRPRRCPMTRAEVAKLLRDRRHFELHCREVRSRFERLAGAKEVL